MEDLRLNKSYNKKANKWEEAENVEMEDVVQEGALETDNSKLTLSQKTKREDLISRRRNHSMDSPNDFTTKLKLEVELLNFSVCKAFMDQLVLSESWALWSISLVDVH